MPISNRSSTELKSILIETLLAFDRQARTVIELKLSLDTTDDATLAAQLGVTSGEANSIKGVVANIHAALTSAASNTVYDAVLLRTLFGMHPV